MISQASHTKNFHLTRIVFWEPCTSPHKVEFLSALANCATGIEILCCAHEGLPLDRKMLGWSISESDVFQTIISPSIQSVEKIVLEQQASTLHIFSGIRWVSTIVLALKLVKSTNSRFAIWHEPRVREGWRGEMRFIQSWLTEGWLRKKSEFVLAIGRNGPPWFISVGYPVECVFPFAYFVDPPAIAFGDTNATRNENQIIQVGYVGRLVQMKGVFDLVTAAAKLGKAAHLSIVGAGPEEQALKTTCAKLQLDAEFLGVLPISEVGAFMKRLDVLVLASTTKDDGWGVVVSEALMAGTAVVATTCVGASLVLDEPVFGRCVPAQSSDAIAQAIKQLQAEGAFTSDMRYRRAMMARQCLSAEGGARHLLEIIQWRFAGAERPVPFYTI